MDSELRRPAREAGHAGQIYHFKVERTRRQDRQVVGRRQRDAHVPGRRAARRRGARPLRLQRLGREGLLRQRQGHAACPDGGSRRRGSRRRSRSSSATWRSRVDRLRSLYEQYFMGIERLEPTVPRKDVDRRIQSLRKEQIRNTALRFRFQMILQRYNTYQTHWMRICREIENGTYKRHLLKRAQQRFGDGRAGRGERPPPAPEPARALAQPGKPAREPRGRAGGARRGVRADAGALRRRPAARRGASGGCCEAGRARSGARPSPHRPGRSQPSAPRATRAPCRASARSGGARGGTRPESRSPGPLKRRRPKPATAPAPACPRLPQAAAAPRARERSARRARPPALRAVRGDASASRTSRRPPSPTRPWPRACATPAPSSARNTARPSTSRSPSRTARPSSSPS